MNEEYLNIRPMIEDDFPQAAIIMTHAFRGKMVALKSWPNERVTDLFLYLPAFDKNNLEGSYVYTYEEKVVGIVCLKWKKQQKSKTTPKYNIFKAIRRFGMFKLLFTIFSFVILGSKVTKDEMMVDYIAIDPEYRGKGIGSKLLDFGENQARKNKDIKVYSLMVIGQNIKAIKLYERIGFKVVKTTKFFFLRIFTGVKEFHYMVKNLYQE